MRKGRPVTRTSLPGIFLILKKRFGDLSGWWPGETKDHIAISAVLTQQTTWKSVERCMAGLKAHGLDSIEAVSRSEPNELWPLIRPSGFYRQKAERLVGMSRSIMRYGSLDMFLGQPAGSLRKALLSMKGIGEETADSIMLFAARKDVFVIDAYTRRVLSRVFGDGSEAEGYSALQGRFHKAMPAGRYDYREAHAHYVQLCKEYCTKRAPNCRRCPLNSVCMYCKEGKRF